MTGSVEGLAERTTRADGRASCREAFCEDSLIEFIRDGWHVLEPKVPFVQGWVVEAICHHLEAVTRGEVTRLLINVPPGTTKSMSTSVFWPAWEWGPEGLPDTRYIRLSFTDSNSIRDNLRCRDLTRSEWYRGLWGTRWTPRGDLWGKTWFGNRETGWQFASSTRSDLTGKRGDRLILDDPNAVQSTESEQVRDETLRWFSETLPSRVNNERSAIVVIMQRVHEQDVAGHILANELGYEHLVIPMEFEADRKCRTSVRWKDLPEGSPDYIWHDGWEDPRTSEGELAWPERFTAAGVEDLKKALRSWGGEYAVAGQLQQRPAPRGGGMFKRSYFNIVPEPIEPVVTVVRGWDLASSKEGQGAQTAAVKMGMDRAGRIYVMHAVADRWSPGEVESRIKGIAEIDGMDVVQDLPQDPGQAGKAQKAAIARLLHGRRFSVSPETGSKEDRARPLAAQAEAGNLYLILGAWNESYIQEATVFPAGRLKDQVDASSRAYARLLSAPREMDPLGMMGELIT